MGYRTILVHCDSSAKLSHRLGVAAELAQRHGAKLIGAYVQEPFDFPMFSDGMMVAMDDLVASFEQTAAVNQARAAAAPVRARIEAPPPSSDAALSPAAEDEAAEDEAADVTDVTGANRRA